MKKAQRHMRRAFVSLPNGVWQILDDDFKGQIGEGDSEVIRNIVVSYLSDRGYFINQKGEGIAGDMQSRLDTIGTMLEGLVELLEEKRTLTFREWDEQIRKKIEVRRRREQEG